MQNINKQFVPRKKKKARLFGGNGHKRKGKEEDCHHACTTIMNELRQWQNETPSILHTWPREKKEISNENCMFSWWKWLTEVERKYRKAQARELK